ncbi:MAG: PDZ domain-containing protein, partial [Pirellulaceae bacterium]|nr:PDZ domain-containing protein [Pirellulaceae bacterium]
GFLSGALATVFATGDYARQGVTVANSETQNDQEKPRVYFNSVLKDSSAYESGIRVDDTLVSFDQNPIEAAAVFSKLLGGFESSSPAKIVIKREGQESTFDVPVKSQWATVNWFWYLASAAISIVGIVLIRKSKQVTVGQDAKTEADLQQLTTSLSNLIAKTEKLSQEIKDYKPRQIVHYIEDELHDDLRDFADGRDSITVEFGLPVFAEVMTEFAAGERAINRAWSASADGYVEEAETCIARALKLLQLAQNKLTVS